ncbi:MAG: carboxypeptidase regulatory-like domain-containing protein, partial [Cytophagaceae bacterium]
MARLLYSAFLLCIVMGFATAQSITGSVQNVGNTPASFAALKLLRTADSTFVKGTVADEAGRFTFSNVPEGTYRVQASFVGMINANSNAVVVQAGQVTYLGPIVLQSSAQALKTVTVRASKSYVEQQADKTVLNVAANASVQGKTAYELLQQAPGVVIDPNDNVRMAGKQGVN